jgi:stage II sporulation protein AA (anti-sigma F factor antagonist)
MDLKWPLGIVEEESGGVLVLTLAGRLGAGSAASFEAAVAEAVGRGEARLVVDLTGVDYISSAGLQALSAAAGRCARSGGGLALCGVSEPVRIALDLGGLLEDLPPEPSRDDAIARILNS